MCELLQGGAVMNKSFQPHEAHIPYLLQLFIDYNLYGMNMINLAAVKFRKSHATGNADRYLCTRTAIIARLLTINTINNSLVDDTTANVLFFVVPTLELSLVLLCLLTYQITKTRER